MIALHNVSKQYGNARVVDQVSFEVQAGETLALLGTSGSGKTTTLKMINRLVEPTTGDILVNGVSIWQQPATELRRNIGYVIQQIGLFPHWNVRQNITTVPRLLKWPLAKQEERVVELLDLVGLPAADFAHRLPSELSGGQRQRIGLARALAADPAIVLLDEPLGALDPISRSHLQQEFLTWKSKLKKTMVLVTHDVQEAFLLGDRVAVMDAGRVLQLGTPHELLHQPADSFIKQFLQDQRFSLELLTTPLSAVAEQLPKGQPTNHSLERKPTQALADALSLHQPYHMVWQHEIHTFRAADVLSAWVANINDKHHAA